MTDTSESVVETPVVETNAPVNSPSDEVQEPVQGAESTPAADDASETTAEKPKGLGKRIDELTRDKYAERRGRENAERQAAYWQEQAQKTQAPPEKPAAPLTQPKLADFEYDEEKHATAVAEYSRKLARTEVDAVLAERETKQKQQQVQESWQKRQDTFRAKSPDYEEVAYSAPISDDIATLIVALDDGPQVAYHLGKNPDIARSISALPREMAAVELGRIAARLEVVKAATPPPVRVSQAPPPPPRIDAVEPAIEKDPLAMSDNEFSKWRRRQIAQRR